MICQYSEKIQDSGLTIVEQQSIWSLFEIFIHGQAQRFYDLLSDGDGNVKDISNEYNKMSLLLFQEVNYDLELFELALKELSSESQAQESVYVIWNNVKEYYDGSAKESV